MLETFEGEFLPEWNRLGGKDLHGDLLPKLTGGSNTHSWFMMFLSLTGLEFWRPMPMDGVRDLGKLINDQSKVPVGDKHRSGVIGHIAKKTDDSPAKKKRKTKTPKTTEPAPTAEIPVNLAVDSVEQLPKAAPSTSHPTSSPHATGIPAIDANPVLAIANAVSSTVLPLFTSLRTDLDKLARQIKTVHTNVVSIAETCTVGKDLDDLEDKLTGVVNTAVDRVMTELNRPREEAAPADAPAPVAAAESSSGEDEDEDEDE